MSIRTSIKVPERIGDAAEINYGEPAGADFGPLARDLIPVRSMVEEDLRSLTSIDRQITGRDRSAYFEGKLEEALRESDVRISLVAELDGRPVGFIMARVDFGEFGMTQSEAVMDTIGVDPELLGRDIATALLSVLLGNLEILRVESVRTEVPWNNYVLLSFLEARGFRPSQRLSLTRVL